MKSKKISISELKVKSFVTDLNPRSLNTINGGTNVVDCHTPNLESDELGICEGSCPSYLYITQEVNEHGVGVVCL